MCPTVPQYEAGRIGLLLIDTVNEVFSELEVAVGVTGVQAQSKKGLQSQ